MESQLHFAARSDVGLVRSTNQDAGYAGQHLLVLADGMGGPAGGDIASSVVVAHLAHLDSDTVPVDQLLTRLRESLQGAHDELVERSEVDPQLKGLGTTCIAVLRSGNKLAMVHIGDSRAYLLRDGVLTQVTTDHSFVQYLVDTGQITPEEAENHPRRSVILRVLGDAPGPIDADETIRSAVLGDRWLLCSDGLSGVVSADTIADVMSSTADPAECAEELIRLALLAGAPDNVTCVVADVVSGTAMVPTVPQVVGAAAVDRDAPSRRGPGAAAKAAALTPDRVIPGQDGNQVEDEFEDEVAYQKRRRRTLNWIKGLVATFLVALVALGLYLSYSWSQEQYFVLANDKNVVIYQGIPQTIGPVELGQPIEVTDIELADLPAIEQLRLQEPVTRSSRAEIDEYIDELRAKTLSGEDAEGGARPQSGGEQSGGSN